MTRNLIDDFFVGSGTVGRFLDGLLKRVMGFERPLVTLGRPWRRLEDDNVISVYLMNGPVDVSQLRANIQVIRQPSCFLFKTVGRCGS